MNSNASADPYDTSAGEKGVVASSMTVEASGKRTKADRASAGSTFASVRSHLSAVLLPPRGAARSKWASINSTARLLAPARSKILHYFLDFLRRPVIALAGIFVSVALPAHAAVGDTSNLLLQYKFDETGGAKVVDSSGHGFNGTYVNQPAWGKGIDGRSFKLAGGAANSAPYVQIPNGVLKGLDAVTIATWVKWEGDGAWQWLFAMGRDADRYLFATPKSAGGSLFSAIKDGNERGLNGPGALEVGKWRHLAVTIDSTTGRGALYLDGAKVAENASSNVKPSLLYDAAKDFSGYIGKSFFPDPFFKGEVDDFRVYGKALTAEQVGSIYGEGMPPAQAVALVKENLSFGRAIVSKDIALPTSSYGATIQWKSSNPAVLSDTGKVTRPAAGQPVAQIALTAAIRKGPVADTKTFSVNVLPVGKTLKMASDNPIFKADGEGNLIFTADPAVLVDGDTLYVYAGQDDAAIGGWFNMNRWVCYSTKDMVNWKYEGPVMKATDFSWGAPGTAWACHVVKKNGKYYFFSTTGRQNRQGYSVGIAVADRPTGPFVDVKKAPLFDNALTTGGALDSIEDIDPVVFLDDDGQGYIYWGNGTSHYALLSDDLMSLKDLNGDGKITQSADIFTDVPIKDRPGIFGEAPWLFKAKGKYYLVYAAGLPQRVVYAMANSPRGPWEYKGVILGENLCPDGSRGDFNSDTSHPAIVEFKGQWYVFYHNAAQPTGGQTRRSVSVEKMAFNADGSIKRSEITSTGISGVASRIQSLSRKDQFVRFENFAAKLEKPGADVHPFQWEFTLGLADEATVDTVSIQCVSHPGYYLTVDGDKVLLAKNDNSPKFKRSATFRMGPGLGDKTGVSFQSLADPKLFLRQSGGALKASAASAASSPSDKQDATFNIQ